MGSVRPDTEVVLLNQEASVKVPANASNGSSGAEVHVGQRTPRFHVVLHRPFDLGRIDEAADGDRGPRHVMNDVARTLDATVHFPTGTAGIRLVDRILGSVAFGSEVWAQARHVLDQMDPGDVVYVSDLTGLAIGAINARRRHPVKVWEIVTWPDKRLIRFFGRVVRWSGGIDRWSSNTPDKTKALARALRLGAAAMVVPEEVDATFFRPGPRYPALEAPLVFAAGREARDYATLAAATEGLAVETLVCAVSPSNPSARTMTVPTTYPDNFRFEMLEWPEFRAAYQRAAVVAVPLLERAGSPGLSVILEAMACGRPVVASRVSGYVSELIDAGVVVGVPIGDVSAWRRIIERVVADPTAYDDVAERGYRYVTEHHTTAAFVETMVTGMRQLAET